MCPSNDTFSKIDQALGQLRIEMHNLKMQNELLAEGGGLMAAESLNSAVAVLAAKVDALQANIPIVLAAASGSVQYANFILAAFAIAATILGFLFQHLATKNKKEAIKEAKKSLEDSLGQGLLPKESRVRLKIIEAIISSEEFKSAVEAVIKHQSDTEKAETFIARSHNCNEAENSVTIDAVNSVVTEEGEQQ